MSFPLFIAFATLGSVIGAVINYALSFYLGRPLMYRFVNSRLGHLCLLNQEKLERAEAYFDKRGVMATLIGRLLPGIRQLISIPAGLSRMHFGHFVIFTAIGAGLWNIILALLGWYLQKVVPLEQLDEAVKQYERPIIAIIISAVVLATIVYCFRKFRSSSH